VADDHASTQSTLLAQHPNYCSPSQRDADDGTLLVAVVDADADDRHHNVTPMKSKQQSTPATTRPTIARFLPDFLSNKQHSTNVAYR
jgi:hypothetical protein